MMEPEPSDVPAPPQAMMSLEGFVITEATTGGDLTALLSGQETSCVKAGLGDAVFQLIKATPITLMAGGDISQTAPLFNCLKKENVVTSPWHSSTSRPADGLRRAAPVSPRSP